MAIVFKIRKPEAWAAAGADIVQDALRQKPSAIIGFPTGVTPLPCYAELRRRVERGELEVSRLRCLMLDDYLGANDGTPSSYQWLQRELFLPMQIAPDRVLRIPTDPDGIVEACATFEQKLANWGGCDLMLLGLGANGHIAFNEPGAEVGSRTRAVALTPETARSNAAYWGGRFVPTRAVTVGIGTILESRRIALLVTGAAKAGILQRALNDSIRAAVPASFIRLAPEAIVLADAAAAASLPATSQDGLS